MYVRINGLGMTPSPPPVGLSLRTPGWGLHTVRGGVEQRDRRFRPRFVGVVDIRKDL